MTSSQARPRDAAPIRSDEALFAAYRDQADEAALESLLERNWNGAYHIALSFTRDPASAEDLAQEACLKVLKAAQDRRYIENFAPWLRTVVANLARSQLRSQRSRARREETVARSREQGQDEQEKQRALRELTAKLEPAQRQALELHYGLGLSHAEVAATLGCAKGTISTRIRAGLERLRQSFGKRGVTLSLAALTQLYQREAKAAAAITPAMPSIALLLARAGLTGSLAAGTGAGLSLAGVGPWLAGAAVVAAGAWFLAGLLDTEPPSPVATFAPRPARAAREPVQEKPPGESPTPAAEAADPPAAEASANATGPQALGTPVFRLGARVPRHPGHSQLVLSPDGRSLLSLSSDELRLWDAESMKPRRSLKPPEDSPEASFFAAAFLDEGRRLVSINGDELVVWDPDSGAILRRLKAPIPEGLPFHGAVLQESPDGRLLAGGFGAGPVALHDLKEPGEAASWRPGFETYGAAFSPDGSLLATAENHSAVREVRSRGLSGDRRIMVWDTGSRRRRFDFSSMTRFSRDLAEDMPVAGLGFSADGNTLFAGVGQRLRAWDMVEGQEIKPHRSFQATISCLIVSPELQTIIAGFEDGSIRVIESSDRATRFELTGHRGPVHSLRLAPDGRTLRSGGMDGTIRTWDLESGKALNDTAGQFGPIRLIRFAPDGRHFASASEDRTIDVWDAETGERLCGFGRADLQVDVSFLRNMPVSLSPRPIFAFRDNNSIVALSNNTLNSQTFFLVLDLDKGAKRAPILGPEMRFKDNPWVLADAAGTRWFDAGIETTAIVSLGSGKTELELPISRVDLITAALSEDGQILALGTRGEALIYEVGGGQLLKRWSLPAPLSKESFGLSAAGDRLYTSDDAGLSAWDISNGERLWSAPALRFAAASPKGSRVAAFDARNRIVILEGEGRASIRSEALEAAPTTAAFQPRAGKLIVGLEDGRSLIFAIPKT